MVNWDRISELREEVGTDDLAEVLELFCEEVEEVLGQLPGADQASLKGHLHFLKGSALNIGLETVSKLCRDAEKTLQANPDASIRIQDICATYEADRIELADLL